MSTLPLPFFVSWNTWHPQTTPQPIVFILPHVDPANTLTHIPTVSASEATTAVNLFNAFILFPPLNKKRELLAI